MGDVFSENIVFAGLFPGTFCTGRPGVGVGVGVWLGLGFMAFSPKSFLMTPEPYAVHTNFHVFRTVSYFEVYRYIYEACRGDSKKLMMMVLLSH